MRYYEYMIYFYVYCKNKINKYCCKKKPIEEKLYTLNEILHILNNNLHLD